MLLEVLRKVESQLLKELPFVIYRKPNSKEVHAIFQKENELHYTKDFSEAGFIFAPFDSKTPVVLMPLHEHLQADIGAMTKSVSGLAILPDELVREKEFHLNLIQKGAQKINKGYLDKVVVSRKLEVDCQSPPLEIFQRLLANYDSAFCYLWYHPKVGMWLGATPEILLRTTNNRLTTMSLAGTQTSVEGKTPSWGQKELDEQRMVTEYISNALQNEVSQMKIGNVESVRAGDLWHLRTKITAVYQKNLLNIIRVLHPTPAVCGLPLPPARKFIMEHENYNREYYTGFLGELNFKQEITRTSNDSRNQENKAYRSLTTSSELFVNLRCMKLADSKATLYVGGGITKDSIPENEWQETVAKSKTLLRVLSI
jgi:isochorismate synthase